MAVTAKKETFALWLDIAYDFIFLKSASWKHCQNYNMNLGFLKIFNEVAFTKTFRKDS